MSLQAILSLSVLYLLLYPQSISLSLSVSFVSFSFLWLRVKWRRLVVFKRSHIDMPLFRAKIIAIIRRRLTTTLSLRVLSTVVLLLVVVVKGVFFFFLLLCILPSLMDSPYSSYSYPFSQSLYSYSSLYRSFFLFIHVLVCVFESRASIPLSFLFFSLLFLFFFLLWGVSRPWGLASCRSSTNSSNSSSNSSSSSYCCCSSRSGRGTSQLPGTSHLRRLGVAITVAKTLRIIRLVMRIVGIASNHNEELRCLDSYLC